MAEALDQSNYTGTTGIGFGDIGEGRRYMVQGFKPTLNDVTAVSFQMESKDYNDYVGILMWIDNADASSNPTGTKHVGIGGVTEITNGEIVTGSLTKYSLSASISVTPGNQYCVCFCPWNTTTHALTTSYHDFMSSVSNPYSNGRRVHLDDDFANPVAPDSGNADLKFETYGTEGTTTSTSTTTVLTTSTSSTSSSTSSTSSSTSTTTISTSTTTFEYEYPGFIQGIDMMGWTKDYLDNPISATQINAQVDAIKRDFPTLTHIGISVPMNTNAEALADRGYNFAIEPATYAARFADKIHAVGLSVLWRMTDCWFEAGGLYSMTYKGDELNSYWLNRALDYVDNNIDMFESGDIIAPYPEADAHQQLDEGGMYNDFMVDLKAGLDTVCANNGITCYNGFTSQNFTGVIQGGRSGDMFTIPNMCSVDHYGACLGPGMRFTSGDSARQTSISGSDTYTVPLAITESATTRCDFIPEKIAYNETIDVYIVNKGTGNWTMTIHNSSNALVQMPNNEDITDLTNTGTVTKTNANLTNGAWNIFSCDWDNPDCDATYHFHLTSTVADGTVRVLTGHPGNLNYCAHEQYKCNANADAMEIDLRKASAKHSVPMFLEEWGDFWSIDEDRSNPIRNEAQHITYLQTMYAAWSRLKADGTLKGFNYWRSNGGNEAIYYDDDPPNFDYQLLYNGVELQTFFGNEGTTTSTTSSSTSSTSTSSTSTSSTSSSTSSTSSSTSSTSTSSTSSSTSSTSTSSTSTSSTTSSTSSSSSSSSSTSTSTSRTETIMYHHHKPHIIHDHKTRGGEARHV